MRTMKTMHVFMRYVMVGLMNTGLCFMLMYLGSLCGLSYLYYTAMAYIVTILFSFFMNLWFTFRMRGRFIKRMCFFVLFGLFNLACVEVIEYGLVEWFARPPWVAVLCGMSWYMIVGFCMNRFVIYRSRPQT